MNNIPTASDEEDKKSAEENKLQQTAALIS